MDTGPQNVLTGDNFGTDLPETEPPEDELIAERNMAKFSKSKEFKKLKETIEAKIVFYQEFLPDGRPITKVTNVDAQELAMNWKVANIIISEFQDILGAYELAKDAVRKSDTGRT